MSESEDQQRVRWRLKYTLLRLQGLSKTQAEWRMREEKKPIKKSRIQRHMNCEKCGHLMLIGSDSCPGCGQRPHLPPWLQRLSNITQKSDRFGVITMSLLCVLGYLLQTRSSGSLFSPIPSTPFEQMKQFVELGAILPELKGFGAYLAMQQVIPMEYANSIDLNAQPWRLFTYTLLHGSLMHIGFNLYALYQIGPAIERVYGSARSLLIWLFSGATAIVFPSIIGIPPTHPVIGASGAVFGFIGVAMLYGHRLGTTQGIYVRNEMIRWTIYCTIFGFMIGGVAHAAHFGGLAGGALLQLIISPPNTSSARARSLIIGLITLLIMALCVYFGSNFQSILEPR